MAQARQGLGVDPMKRRATMNRGGEGWGRALVDPARGPVDFWECLLLRVILHVLGLVQWEPKGKTIILGVPLF